MFYQSKYFKDIRSIAFKIFEGAGRLTVSLLIIVILITITWAVFRVLADLGNTFNQSITDALKVVMTDSLTILALLEVFRTTLTYFFEGRVKVTYIIDTVLVVILTEVMALQPAVQSAIFMMNVLCMDYVHLSELLPTQDMLDEYKKHGGNWDVNFAIIPFV